MSRIVIPALLFLTALYPAAAAEQGQLDGSPTLFSVLAAINAAGYDADLASSANHTLREAVRREILARNPPVLAELKRFFAVHKQSNPTAELSQYISFALSVKGPPDFEIRFRHVDIPPDVLPLQSLPDLMKRFHAEARIDDLWDKAQPAYEEAIARYHEPVSRAVLEVNAYLRNQTSGFLGRRFQIYIDLLGAPNQIQTRSYADDYFVVLTPSPQPQTEDVRHAYLHYLLDPTATKYGDLALKKRGLADFAKAAPALAEHYKEDFLLLATESLIKAVESRLARTGSQEIADRALREGFVLTPHFVEQLPVYEKQEQAMRLYFPELVNSIDLKKEDRRLAKIEFAPAVKERKAKVVQEQPKPEPAGAYKTVEEAEELYAKKKFEEARKVFARVLQETDDKPLHARAYYGLARIAILQKDPELGDRLFRKALEMPPDPLVKAWVLVYLGRLADVSGDRAEATKHYQQALAVDGASPAARNAAEKGMQEGFEKK